MKLRIVALTLFLATTMVPFAIDAVGPNDSSPQSSRDACNEALSELSTAEDLPSPPTTEALLNWSTNPYYLARSLCTSFIAESRDSSDFHAVVSGNRGKGEGTEHSYCVPVLTQPGQLADVLVWWADENPERQQGTLEERLMDAFDKAYPCEGPWDPRKGRSGARKSATRSQDKVPDRCPRCSSERVLEMVFGLPGPDFDSTRFVSHGCIVVNGAPRWHCDNCNHEWGLLIPDFY